MNLQNLLGMKLPKWHEEIHLEPVGSRVTCNPPPTDTDKDYLCYNQEIGLHDILTSNGYIQDGNPEFYTGNDSGVFRSFRKGNVNIITTPDLKFYRLFLTATKLAKRFNLLEKADRIALFQAVLYGVIVPNLATKA